MQFFDLLHKRCCVFLFLHCIWFLTPAFVIGIGHTCNWLILIQCLVCQFEKVSNTVYHILYTPYIYQKKYHTTPVKSIFLTASLTVSVFVMISSESSVREVIYGRYLLRITNAYVMVCDMCPWNIGFYLTIDEGFFYIDITKENQNHLGQAQFIPLLKRNSGKHSVWFCSVCFALHFLIARNMRNNKLYMYPVGVYIYTNDKEHIVIHLLTKS